MAYSVRTEFAWHNFRASALSCGLPPDTGTMDVGRLLCYRFLAATVARICSRICASASGDDSTPL